MLSILDKRSPKSVRSILWRSWISDQHCHHYSHTASMAKNVNVKRNLGFYRLVLCRHSFLEMGAFGGKCNRNLKSVIECYKMHLWSHCKLHSLCLRTHALSLEYKPGIVNIWFPSVHLWPENQRFSDIFQKREKWAFTVHPTTNHQKLLVQKTNGNFTSETNLQLSAIRSKFNSSWPTDQWWQTSMRPYHQWNQYVLPWLTQFL